MSDITIDRAVVHAHMTGFSDGARDVIELRLLVELSVLRQLADRGLSDPELAVAGRLADATMRAARSGDVVCYLRADVDFHLCLLELAGDPVVAQIGRHLLAAEPAPPAADCAGQLTAGADEHRELVTCLPRAWSARPMTCSGTMSPGRGPARPRWCSPARRAAVPGT
jgi:DNA-binding GntR family transcriptional regulator